eukprot:CAMPEP_0175123614 /NCGR_PEP_ID=MMETSP0087-20121206/2339_1 /TAXON_ID=136419 /ORGANISM="Unknown Unknown, Strain D1" /LENGTH=302 /DNA_ID=CAMNT_0016405321 /DNA_START=477 /DNA_END=1385 /DNA_ORIENTATION=+
MNRLAPPAACHVRLSNDRLNSPNRANSTPDRSLGLRHSMSASGSFLNRSPVMSGSNTPTRPPSLGRSSTDQGSQMLPADYALDIDLPPDVPPVSALKLQRKFGTSAHPLYLPQPCSRNRQGDADAARGGSSSHCVPAEEHAAVPAEERAAVPAEEHAAVTRFLRSTVEKLKAEVSTARLDCQSAVSRAAQYKQELQWVKQAMWEMQQVNQELEDQLLRKAFNRDELTRLGAGRKIWQAWTQKKMRQRQKPHLAECIVCMVNPREVVCLPCGHVCTCVPCSSQLITCPYCRRNINSTQKVFLC